MGHNGSQASQISFQDSLEPGRRLWRWRVDRGTS